jgi:hypothetical protein
MQLRGIRIWKISETPSVREKLSQCLNFSKQNGFILEIAQPAFAMTLWKMRWGPGGLQASRT